MRHFVGCSNEQEVKSKFRSLAKEHHPDRGGDVAIFVEVKQEYDKIIGGTLSYPISDTPDTTIVFDSIFQWASDNNVSTRRTRRTKTTDTYSAFASAQQARTENFFNILRVDDPLFDVLDGVMEESLKYKSPEGSIVFEMDKIDDLSLNHFKYIQFMKKYHKEWANAMYRRYLISKSKSENSW